jgi:DNA-binding GntR family transcriptional regulator
METGELTQLIANAPAKRGRADGGNVTDRTYDALRAMIMRRELKPGEVIEERRLAEELSVSRTPLRAAVSRLLGENVLTRLSNRTLVVQSLSMEEFLEIVHVRKLLESEAAALAAGRIPTATIKGLRQMITEFERAAVPNLERHWEIDDLLHNTIAAYSKNSHLEKLINDVRNRARMCNIGKVPARLEMTAREHKAILAALESGDADGARLRMVEHIDGVRQGFLSLLGANQK